MAMMGTTNGTPHVGARCRVPVGDVMGSDLGAGLRPAREDGREPSRRWEQRMAHHT
jgi:hypothetical protein